MAVSKQQRDARLDALATATKAWAAQQRQYLQAQSALCKRILKGRMGVERLKDSSVTLASDLLVDEINKFLTG